MKAFIYELKRRNVLKVAAGYALVSWILIESGSVLMPTFGVPDWFFKVYVIIVFGGFIVAMIIAWVFELTPEGVRLESEIDRSSEPPPETGSSGHFGLILLLAAALVISITLNFSGFIKNAETPATVEATTTRVAVLPFENRSVDPENAFLTDGVHEDLIHRLQKVGSLHVISRTSAIAIMDSPKTLKEIGEALDVTTIVEGSVQRAGDEVLVSVRVFNAGTENLLWDDSFTRDASVQGFFDLQHEISSRIVSALPIAASDVDAPANTLDPPTHDPRALAAFVEGVNQLGRREYSSLIAARKNFETAIEIDPGYARAHAKLAETIMVLYSNHRAMTIDEAASLAMDAINNALEIDPLQANAIAVRGMVEASVWQLSRVGDGNARAAADFERALAINPNSSTANVWFSTLLDNEGKVDKAIERLRIAIDLDPRNRIPYINLPGLLAANGQTDEAVSMLLYTIDLFPTWSLPNDFLSRHLQGLGRIDEAVAWAVRLRELSEDPLAGANSLGLFRLLGYEDQIDQFIESIPEGHGVIPIGQAYERFIRGDHAAARTLLEDLIDTDYSSTEYFYPMLATTAVLGGDYESARRWIMRGSPRLSSDRDEVIDHFNADNAILLGFVEAQLGNTLRSRQLLEAALAVTRDQPRVGFVGFGIIDVQALALLGRTEEAIDAFEDAVEAGFVSNLFFDLLEVDQTTLLDSLRDEPRFIAALDVMYSNLSAMAANVETAVESGDWAALQELTRARSSLVSGRL